MQHGTATLLTLGCAALWGLGTAEGAGGDSSLRPQVAMETSLGKIVLQLDGEKAPGTTLNFLQYAKDKYYDGTIFHRVMSNFMIQGGGFTPDVTLKREGLRPPIDIESDNGLSNARGTIAMARTRDPDSATSQFFINVVDNKRLDYRSSSNPGYTVFGKVIEGMDVVDKIRNTEVAGHPKYGGGNQKVVPVDPVIIKSVRLVGDFDRAAVEAKLSERQAAAAEAEAKQAAADAKQAEAVAEKIKEAKDKGTKTSSGLIYYDRVTGDGTSPEPTDRVTVHYTGWLTNGKKFDSSVDRGQPATFPLNRVIPGWTEGVGSMKVGGKRTLIIPYDLAYGEAGHPPTIPPKATLVFDVELLAVQ